MRNLTGFGSAIRTEIRSIRAGWVAGQQWGVIGADQLRDVGVGPSMVKRWRARGLLHERHPGVYLFGHESVPIEGALVAALLHAGPDAVLSHATAAWWWRLIPHPPETIEVSSANDVKSTDGVIVHHPRRISGTRHRRLPVTTVAQTLLDFASQASKEQLRLALAEAEYRDLLNVDEVRAVLGRGRPGSRALRKAIARHEPRYAWARSRLERAFLDLCRRHRIPLPQLNVTVNGWLVDAVWPEQRVVVELDGYRNHRTRAQLERDHERDLQLRAAGYTVVRYTEAQVRDQPKKIAADLRALLRRGR